MEFNGSGGTNENNSNPETAIDIILFGGEGYVAFVFAKKDELLISV